MLLERIRSILQSSCVQKGIIIEYIKREINSLVTEKLEIQCNGISELPRSYYIPCSRANLLKEKQQECLEIQENVLMFSC